MLDRSGDKPAPNRSALCVDLAAGAEPSATVEEGGPSAERVSADLALTVALDRVAAVQEAKARYTADTADDAYRLMMATQDAAQAMLSAFLGFRDRVAAS